MATYRFSLPNSADIGSVQCFHQMFEAQAASGGCPDAIAVESAEGLTSYAALNRRANQLARYLMSRGVGPESLVGLSVPRSTSMLVCMLAIAKAGGAYVPLDPRDPLQRRTSIIGDSQLKVLIVEDRSKVLPLPSDIVIVDLLADASAIDAAGEENPEPRAALHNLAYVMYTSGSTGQPKGVAMEHKCLANLMAWHGTARSESCGLRTLQFCSIGFDFSFHEIFSTLCFGGTLVLADESARVDPAALARTIVECRIEKLFLPVSVLLKWAEAVRDDTVPEHLQCVITTGEPLRVTPAVRRLFARTRAKLHNHYGATEFQDATTFTLSGDPALWPAMPPIGRPISNVEVWLLGADHQPVARGETGQIFIGGVGTARGYVRRSELTAQKFIESPLSGGRLYATGDLARQLPDSTFVHLGRTDSQVKIRGFRIDPGEVEYVISEQPAVTQAVVIAREDKIGEKQLVGYVVAESSSQDLIARLYGVLRERLPSYMVPAALVLVDEIPLTANGKVDRKALPAPAGVRESAERYVAPGNEIERELARIWAEVLLLDRVGIEDNFFELGGDSILAIQVTSRANQAGIVVWPRDIFRYQTIRALAQVAGRVSVQGAEQGWVSGAYPLTAIQRWFFEQQLAVPGHWNMAMGLECRESVNPQLLGRAVASLLEHHDVLRSRFVATAAGVQASIVMAAGAQVFQPIDLSGRSVAAQDAEYARHVAAAQASLDLAEGPLLRVLYFDFGSRRAARLVWIIHHLVVDGVSWRILLEDLARCYGQLSRGEQVRLPSKTISFRQWSHAVQRYAQSAALAGEAAFWLEQLPPEVARVPVDFADGDNTTGTVETVWIHLGREDTERLLTQVPSAYNTQVNDVLLTALLKAFQGWMGAGELIVALEGHGREELDEVMDTTRTVGWFTTLFPVRLSVSPAADPGTALKAIKEQLRKVPNKGLGYGLLHYLRGDRIGELLRERPRPQVSFNYLGRYDHMVPEESVFRQAQIPLGSCQSSSARRAHLLDVDGLIKDGCLSLQWTYSSAVHRRSTIETVAARYLHALRELIEHCTSRGVQSFTPSDFPQADLDQSELDRLLGTQ